MTKTEVCDYS